MNQHCCQVRCQTILLFLHFLLCTVVDNLIGYAHFLWCRCRVYRKCCFLDNRIAVNIPLYRKNLPSSKPQVRAAWRTGPTRRGSARKYISINAHCSEACSVTSVPVLLIKKRDIIIIFFVGVRQQLLSKPRLIINGIGQITV